MERTATPGFGDEKARETSGFPGGCSSGLPPPAWAGRAMARVNQWLFRKLFRGVLHRQLAGQTSSTAVQCRGERSATVISVITASVAAEAAAAPGPN